MNMVTSMENTRLPSPVTPINAERYIDYDDITHENNAD